MREGGSRHALPPSPAGGSNVRWECASEGSVPGAFDPGRGRPLRGPAQQLPPPCVSPTSLTEKKIRSPWGEGNKSSLQVKNDRSRSGAPRAGHPPRHVWKGPGGCPSGAGGAGVTASAARRCRRRTRCRQEGGRSVGGKIRRNGHKDKDTRGAERRGDGGLGQSNDNKNTTQENVICAFACNLR